MSYATFSDLGKSTDKNIEDPGDPSNPLTYCLFHDMGVQFLHGSTSSDYAPQCTECQNYMADMCAGVDGNQPWNQACEVYYNIRNDTYWPNEAAIDKSRTNCGHFPRTQGEDLLRNTAERRFLEFPFADKQVKQFDPNVANSPMYNQYNTNNISPEQVITKINKNTIDEDPVMNKVLSNPQPCAGVLAHIYYSYKNKKVNLNGTKIGHFLIKNAQYFEDMLKENKKYVSFTSGHPIINKCKATYNNPAAICKH